MKTEQSKKIRNRYLRIRTLMLKKGITGGDIARTLGVTRIAINSVIKGVFNSPRIRAAIASSLGLPYGKLWGEEKKQEAA
jgi:hypothetical protein